MRDLTTLPSGYVPLTDGQKSAITDAIALVTGEPAPTPSPTPSPTSASGDSFDSADYSADTPEDTAVDAPVAVAQTDTPIVSIFASSAEPIGGLGGFILPLLIIVGIASSIRGTLTLMGGGTG